MAQGFPSTSASTCFAVFTGLSAAAALQATDWGSVLLQPSPVATTRGLNYSTMPLASKSKCGCAPIESREHSRWTTQGAHQSTLLSTVASSVCSICSEAPGGLLAAGEDWAQQL